MPRIISPDFNYLHVSQQYVPYNGTPKLITTFNFIAERAPSICKIAIASSFFDSEDRHPFISSPSFKEFYSKIFMPLTSLAEFEEAWQPIACSIRNRTRFQTTILSPRLIFKGLISWREKYVSNISSSLGFDFSNEPITLEEISKIKRVVPLPWPNVTTSGGFCASEGRSYALRLFEHHPDSKILTVEIATEAINSYIDSVFETDFNGDYINTHIEHGWLDKLVQFRCLFNLFGFYLATKFDPGFVKIRETELYKDLQQWVQLFSLNITGVLPDIAKETCFIPRSDGTLTIEPYPNQVVTG